MYAIIAASLTKLLKKDEPYEWKEKKRFEALEAKQTSAHVLQSPDWKKAYHVYMDTSAFAIGVVLSQKDENKKDNPIYFASRQLLAAEKNYTTTKRKALGMMFFVKKFRHYLLGYKFVFHADHYALQHLVKKADFIGSYCEVGTAPTRVHIFCVDTEGCPSQKCRLLVSIVDPTWRE